jgi:hypothetical protein
MKCGYLVEVYQPSKMKRWVHEGGRGVNKATTPSKMKMWVQWWVDFGHVRKERQNRQKYFLTSRTPTFVVWNY